MLIAFRMQPFGSKTRPSCVRAAPAAAMSRPSRMWEEVARADWAQHQVQRLELARHEARQKRETWYVAEEERRKWQTWEENSRWEWKDAHWEWSERGVFSEWYWVSGTWCRSEEPTALNTGAASSAGWEEDNDPAMLTESLCDRWSRGYLEAWEQNDPPTDNTMAEPLQIHSETWQHHGQHHSNKHGNTMATP